MTINIYAKTGELELLLLSMQMDAKIWQVVSIVMDGKNKTIIQWSIKLSHVQILKTIRQKQKSVQEEVNVHFIIPMKIDEGLK